MGYWGAVSWQARPAVRRQHAEWAQYRATHTAERTETSVDPSNVSPRRMAVAVHEAGHAVAALTMGRPVHHVRLFDGGGGEFRSYPDPQIGHDGEDRLCRELCAERSEAVARGSQVDFDQVNNTLIKLMAGMAAQERYDPTGRHGDVWAHGQTDCERALQLARSLGQSESVVKRRLAACFAHAQHLVGENWDAVSALAKSLAARGRLNEGEIRQLTKRYIPTASPATAGMRTR